MDFDKMIAILERIKDETLVQINETDELYQLVNINNKGVNHGVMQMYYRLLTEIYRAEREHIQEQIARKKVSA